MQITLSWQMLLTATAIIGAFVAIINYIKKIFGWFDRQEKQDKEIKDIKKEQGCNGSVTTTISEIETYLNNKAHGGA